VWSVQKWLNWSICHLFGLWTRVSWRKHKFNRIRQIAPVCHHGLYLCIQNFLYSVTHSTCVYNKELIRYIVQLVFKVWFSACIWLVSSVVKNNVLVSLSCLFYWLIMAALCNRGAIIFLPCSFFPSFFFFLLLFFPRLISAAVDRMSAILLHMAWP